MNFKRIFLSLMLLGTLLMTVACRAETAAPMSEAGLETAVSTNSEPIQTANLADGEPFDIVMSVLTSPRCSNCHPTDDTPRQRDDQIAHLFNVTRGEDNHGGPVQTCDTCHHEENNAYSNVPGAPHWGLAPKSMGWLGLTHAEIAEALLNPETNGERSHEDLLHHMSEDALVLWAWEPGEGRTLPPVSHEEFIEALEAWLDAGAPIPAE